MTNEQQLLVDMKQQEQAESTLTEQNVQLKLTKHDLTANEIKGALVAHQTDVEVKFRKLQNLWFRPCQSEKDRLNIVLRLR